MSNNQINLKGYGLKETINNICKYETEDQYSTNYVDNLLNVS
jgi:hypothetical protein